VTDSNTENQQGQEEPQKKRTDFVSSFKLVIGVDDRLKSALSKLSDKHLEKVKSYCEAQMKENVYKAQIAEARTEKQEESMREIKRLMAESGMVLKDGKFIDVDTAKQVKHTPRKSKETEPA
jgi:hypothetical protein